MPKNMIPNSMMPKDMMSKDVMPKDVIAKRKSGPVRFGRVLFSLSPLFSLFSVFAVPLLPVIAKFSVIAAFLIVATLSVATTNALADNRAAAKNKRPNILLIIADDLGYSDLGFFGSEIATPNLDALAQSSTVFTNMNVHVFCTPTRAMLLTGVDNVIAGIGTMAGEWRGPQKDAVGYETYLSDRVVTIASILQDNDYETFISGKWDLGGRLSDDHLPSKRGFEKSWILVEGTSDHFAAKPALAELPDVNYRQNGKPIDVPKDFYSSKTFTDKMIDFIAENRKSKKPFFGYLAFTAPHYPLQAPAAFIDKYKGVYDAGYAAIRKQRIQNMKDRGLIPQNFVPAEPHPRWPNWQELSPKHRAFEKIRMEAYAGMIDNMDFHIGRVIDYLKEIDAYDDTIIIFLSDNGAEGGNPLDWADYYIEWAENSFDLRIENTGTRTSYAWTGPQWAHVSSAPFRLFKAFPTAGGVRVPMIISYPEFVASGAVSDMLLSAKDVPATLLEITGLAHPGNSYKGRPVAPLEGRSFADALIDKRKAWNKEKEKAWNEEQVIVWEMLARRAVQKGQWKILWLESPWDENDGWALYNLAEDPIEAHDVSKQYPDIVADLLVEWENYVAKNGVIALDKIELSYTNEDSHFNWLPRVERTE